MTTQISVETLSPITHNQIPVVTTELLAQLYGTETANIKMNFSRNTERFVQGKHFFKLEGDELREFKHSMSSKPSVSNEVTESYPVKIARNVRSLILWTERGAARHAKMLETDQAWEVFEKLEDCYFCKKQAVTTQEKPYAVVTYFENGLPIAHHPLVSGEVVMTFESFREMAVQHGWLVIRKEQLLERIMQL